MDNYINREVSWLEFNKRVLSQSIRNEIPLLEKLNFLGISTSNLDEFIMVRLSSIMNNVALNDEFDVDDLEPELEYVTILSAIHEFKKLQSKCHESVIKELEDNDIFFCEYNELSDNEKKYIKKIFNKNIYPLITPINYDTTKEFPELKSKQMTIVVSVQDLVNKNLEVISFIELPEYINKVYRVSNDDMKFITLENIIYAFLDEIYEGKYITNYGSLKILRKADIELEHNEDIYITDRMRSNLIERKFSVPIFMDVSKKMSDDLLKILSNIFKLPEGHIHQSKDIYDFTIYQQVKINNPELYYDRFSPQYPSELIGEYDMFSAINKNDIVLHHPYESYDPVIKFLEHAAFDPDVLSIRQTLYRVSENSPIIEALCNAAMNGKQVSIILEIKARFDEERNISLIEKLKSVGCKLIYGTENLKTHCKFIVIVKKSKKDLKIYSHIGTGNYNDKTAKIYTDISYFTSKFKVGRDLITLFNMISGFSEPTKDIDKIYFSPYNLRKRLYDAIDNEIKLVSKKKDGIIVIKVNSISDKEMIDKLYDASIKGVKITIFCRGICSMKPINENITIISIVGRFLEHSRIFYFLNNNDPDVYISSSDLLTRNLDKRFELLFPIENNTAKMKIIKILSMYFKDNFNSYAMKKNGLYKKIDGEYDIHKSFMKKAIEGYKLKNIPKMMGKKRK